MPALRPLSPADIRRQVVLEEHDGSADGRFAVVGRRAVKGDHYVRHLWVVPTVDGRTRPKTRPLTSGDVLDGWPRISPDGSTVAWIRGYPDDDDRPADLCLMAVDGGRLRIIRPGAHGSPDSLAWSPDGSRIAFTAEVDPPRFLVGRVPPIGRRPAKAGSKAALAAAARPDEPTPIARRIDRADWRWDGVGHLDRWSHLFVVDLTARRVARPRQVTRGDWGVADIAWHPDGRTVAFTSDRGPEPDTRPRTTIWAVDVDAATGDAAADAAAETLASSEPREVLAVGGSATRPAYSPDGRWLAAVGVIDADALDDVSPTLLVAPADGSAAAWALAADLDRPFGNWVDTDLNGWMVSGRAGPAWVDDRRIVAVVTDRSRSHPWLFDVDPQSGRPRGRARILDGDRTTHSIAVSTGGLLSWLGTDGVRAMELSTVGLDAPAKAATAPAAMAPATATATARVRPRIRTTMGGAWQRRHPLPVMTVVEAPGPGGPIETWIASPPDAGDGPLPTVVDVHGGPLGAWAPAPHLEVALLVARGYRVILPNIRGSASYGAGWIRPQLGDWGGVDADDVHAALDHVIMLGLADPDRLGVIGLSYGGFMVNWLVGTTDRFRAAVSENGVTNQVSDWANSDSGPEYDRVALLGDPFSAEGVDKLWRQSPLRFVTNVRTPLLMLQAEADLRCPPHDNEQFFIALRHLGRTVEYVLYPEEYHVFSSSGRPDRRIDRQTRMLDWFDHYLKA